MTYASPLCTGLQGLLVYILVNSILKIIRAYSALYLGGTPSQETGTSPPSYLLLENRLYITNMATIVALRPCVTDFCIPDLFCLILVKHFRGCEIMDHQIKYGILFKNKNMC